MSKPLILIIDDEPLMVKSTRMALNLSGFEALGANSGPEGIHVATDRKPHVILLDVMMPAMDGWQVLAALKSEQETRDIPVIIFTAREYSNGKAMALANGAIDYLPKPFELEELMNILAVVINSQDRAVVF